MTACAIELPTVELRITRSGDPLIIGPTCPDDGGLYYNNLLRPDWNPRYDSLAPSRWKPGQGILLGFQVGGGAVVASVVATGVSQTAIKGLLDELREALGQLEDHTVAIATDDGAEVVDGPYPAWPTVMSRPEPVAPRRLGLLAELVRFSIPVDPPGAP